MPEFRPRGCRGGWLKFNPEDNPATSHMENWWFLCVFLGLPGTPPAALHSYPSFFSPISFCHQTPEPSFIKHRSLLVDAMVNARKSLKGQGRGNLTFFFLGELKQCCFWLCTSFNKITFSSSLLPLPPRQPRHTSMEAEPMTNPSDKMIMQSHLSPPALWVYFGARLMNDSIFLSSLPSHSSDQTPGRLPSGSLHMPRRI